MGGKSSSLKKKKNKLSAVMETTIRLHPFIAGREDLLAQNKFEVTLNQTTEGKSMEEINVESDSSDEDDDFYEDDDFDDDSDYDSFYCPEDKKNLVEGLEETHVENITREEIKNMTEEELIERQNRLLRDIRKAQDRGDWKRAWELKLQFHQLCIRCEELLDAWVNLQCRRKEQERNIEKDAERIKKETEKITQENDSDPQVVEASKFVRTMTEEILEQKGKLPQGNTSLEKVTGVKNGHIRSTTSVKENCRNVKIYLTQVTVLVQDKIHSLPENVKKKLQSLMTSFQRLLDGIWKLLVIVLLLHELEKLNVCPSFEGEHNCRRKGRLKYGFEIAAMLALWLSHDVESNPGPPHNNRMSLEWLLRQLSETLKQELKVKDSLWSKRMAEAAYRAGFPRKFYWNNPSGKNNSGKKDTTETLIMKVNELGHLLRRKECLPKDLAPLLHDLSSETGRSLLRIHCKIENLASAVTVLLCEGLASFQKDKINQVLRKITEVTTECDQLHSSRRGQPSGRDFGPLADKESTHDEAADSIDLLAGNTLSPLEGRKDLGIIMESSTSTEIVCDDTNISPYYTSNMQMPDDSRTTNNDDAGLVDNQFVQLVVSQAEELLKEALTSDGCLLRPGDDDKNVPPEIAIIDDILHGDTDTNTHPLLDELPIQTGASDPRLLTRNYTMDKSNKTMGNSDNVISKTESIAETLSNQSYKPDLIDHSVSRANTTNGRDEISTSHIDGKKQVELPEDDNVNCETLTVHPETDLRLYCQETADIATPDPSSTSGRNLFSIQETTVTRNTKQTLDNDEHSEKADQQAVHDTNLQDSNGKPGHKTVNGQNLEWRANALRDERGQSESAQVSRNGEKSHQHTSLATADSHMKQLKEHLCQEVKNHFDEDVKNFINRCLLHLNIPTSSSKSPQPSNTQTDQKGNASDHENTDEEIKRRLGQLYTGRCGGQPEVTDDIRAQTSHYDHLEETNSSADSIEEDGSRLGISNDLDVTTCRGRVNRKRKQKHRNQSSKRRRH